MFRLADVHVRWSGVDDTTPAGHTIALGVDMFGNTRIWLFRGDLVDGDAYAGSLLVPSSVGRTTSAYGPRGDYVKSGNDQTALLATLAAAYANEIGET